MGAVTGGPPVDGTVIFPPPGNLSSMKIEQLSFQFDAPPGDRDFLAEMTAAADANAGREVIWAHEAEIEALMRRAGCEPACGRIGPNYFRGFSTLTAKERSAAVKAVRAAAGEGPGSRLQVLMDQGVAMGPVFERLHAEEMRLFMGRMRTGAEASAAVVPRRAKRAPKTMNNDALEAVERELVGSAGGA